jgi:hypothetical protein
MPHITLPDIFRQCRNSFIEAYSGGLLFLSIIMPGTSLWTDNDRHDRKR